MEGCRVPKRVDFRALVRDLAAAFRTRIELRQIGVRDEAARLSGVGRCGREYCCSTWLKELSPINLGLAKDQHLSLNPSQISGGCGRLLCCLKYEHDFYVTARKRFPKEGKTLKTAVGPERVIAVDISPQALALARKFGATECVDGTRTPDTAQAVRDLTGGGANNAPGMAKKITQVQRTGRFIVFASSRAPMGMKYPDGYFKIIPPTKSS